MVKQSIFFRRSARSGVAVALCAGLAACSGGSGSTLSLENPDFFSVRTDEGVISGQFNPAGYSTAKVRSLLTNLCAGGRLQSFGSEPREGLTAFSATCAGATKYTWAASEFERMGSGKILIESTYSDGSGNIKFARREVS